jgi:cobalt-zinc-cadmium resistance protein CzcA
LLIGIRVDPEKCQRWGVMTADVNNVVASALGAKAMSSMVEGEKLFDIAIRWPKRLRNNETSILAQFKNPVQAALPVRGSHRLGHGSQAVVGCFPGGHAAGQNHQPMCPSTLQRHCQLTIHQACPFGPR